MTDFEDQLTAVLQQGAEEAPLGEDLVDQARGRLRRRRRTTLAAVLVAVVLVAVPVGVRVVAPGPVHEPLPGGTRPSPTDVRPGWRAETWRDLEIQVPESWGYGTLATWCSGGVTQPAQPVVERPGQVVDSILCDGPANGYGVQFFDPAVFDPDDPAASALVLKRFSVGDGPARYPQGSWVGYAGTLGRLSGDAAIRVVAPTEEVARQLVDSVRRIAVADRNGCAPRVDLVPTGSRPVLARITTIQEISVCAYDVDAGPRGQELLSRGSLLTGGTAQRLLDALRAAAVVKPATVLCTHPPTHPPRPSCCSSALTSSGSSRVLSAVGPEPSTTALGPAPSRSTCWSRWVSPETRVTPGPSAGDNAGRGSRGCRRSAL